MIVLLECTDVLFSVKLVVSVITWLTRELRLMLLRASHLIHTHRTLNSRNGAGFYFWNWVTVHWSNDVDDLSEACCLGVSMRLYGNIKDRSGHTEDSVWMFSWHSTLILRCRKGFLGLYTKNLERDVFLSRHMCCREHTVCFIKKDVKKEDWIQV